MRRTWPAAVVLVLAMACTEKTKGPGPRPDPLAKQTPVESKAGPPPRSEPAPPPPPPKPIVVVPTGAIRLRAATVGEATQLVAVALDASVLALDRAGAESFAIPDVAAAKALDLVAERFEYARTRSGPYHILAPAGRLGRASKVPRRGRPIDLEFSGAPGDDIARLVADVGGQRLAGELGGSFFARLRGVDSNRILVTAAQACGAEIAIAKHTIRLSGSTCDEAEAPIPPIDDRPTLSDEDPDWRRAMALPGVKVDASSVRLVGVAVVGDRKVAMLTASAGTPPSALLREGEYLGAIDDACARWAATQPETSVDPRRVEEARRELDAFERRKPPWCVSPPAPVRELVWRLDAVDSDGVTLVPVLVDPDERAYGRPTPTPVAEWKPGAYPEGLPALRIPISD